MLELGKPGSAGCEKGELPVLRDGAVVAVHRQVFLLWLELVISRRNTAVVTAATTAAVVGGTS